MSTSLLLQDAILPDGRPADIRISGGRISAIGAALPADGARTIPLSGRLAVPGFVDGHIHLDKTLLGAGWVRHIPGATIADRVAAEKRIRQQIEVPVAQRARRLVETVSAWGTTAIRTHVDIDTDIKLAGLHALLALRRDCADLLDIQIVAFPQSGVLADPGTEDLLRQALGEGADLVGGLDPASIDHDIAGQLNIVFDLAETAGVGVDIHLHDPGTLGTFQLREIASRTMALGLQGRVAVSHAFALGQVDDAEFGRTAEELARAGIAIMTTGPGAVAMPPIKPLRAAGVTVFTGSDNIRDAWSPFGTGDMLERAMLVAMRSGFRADDDLDLALHLVTEAPAAALGLREYGLIAGARADLVVLDAPGAAEAIVSRAARHLVIKGGAILRHEGVLVP